MDLPISFGAGVNSTAMTIMLVNEGWRGDIVFANTGAEWPETYCFIDYFESEWLTPRRLAITRLGPEWRKDKRAKTLPGLMEYCEHYSILPLCGIRWCTRIFKIDSCQAYHNDEYYLGIAADESHRQPDLPRPLVERGVTREGCIEIIEAEGLDMPQKSGCYICLAGETEVITPLGAKPISELIGKARVLVPIRQSQWGKWKEVEVKCFGKQRLYRIALHKRRAQKVIYATAEHRWVKLDRKGRMPFVSTVELQPGDILASCYVTSVRASPNAVRPSPFGIAHGFVFGDGTRSKKDSRPASLVVHSPKDRAMLRYFATCELREITVKNGKTATYVYDLPRQWKEFPPLAESRSYLLGWLAGYFAADGHVTARGQAVIYSHLRKNMGFVRDVCYLLGVATSPIHVKNHYAFGKDRTLYSVTIYSRDLPDSFWLNAHHLANIVSSRLELAARRDNWSVKSVEETDRIEDIYCAVVPEQEMFTLADNLITGNCPFQRNDQWHQLWRSHPELIDRAARLEELTTERVRKKGNLRKATLDPSGKITLRQRIYAFENQLELPGIDMDALQRFKPCQCGL